MSLELAPDPRLRKAGPLGTGAEKEQREGDDERDEPTCLEGEDGRVAGTAQTGWTTNLANTEYRDLRPNLAALENLAKQTGGRVIKASELDELAESLPSERAPVMETWTQPLWHTPWVMLGALVCFVSEWGLRRRSGLA